LEWEGNCGRYETKLEDLPMTDIEIERTRAELIKAYPGCRVKVAEDKREMVAEITDKFAVKKGSWLDVASQAQDPTSRWGLALIHNIDRRK
jgi:hypothetical protein